MTTPADDIRATQLRNRLDETGDMVACAIRDAYARGLADGLARGRAEVADEQDDVAQRRPSTV